MNAAGYWRYIESRKWPVCDITFRDGERAAAAEIIACVGGDTHRDREFHEAIKNFSIFSREAVYPYGAAGPNALFASITRAYKG